MNRVERALNRIAAVPWFCNIGQGTQTRDNKPVADHLELFCDKRNPVLYVKTLEHAEQALRIDFDPDWMEYEDQYRKALVAEANQSSVDSIHQQALNRILIEFSDDIMKRARLLLPYNDEYWPRVATGCAVEACYFFVVESDLMCKNSMHFTAKFEIFEQGHWPLCLSKGRFTIF